VPFMQQPQHSAQQPLLLLLLLLLRAGWHSTH
jgi:hypothetical protein